MSEATLKIVRARPCACPKCKPTAEARLASLNRLAALAKAAPPAKPAAPTHTMADYVKAIVALVSQGKLELPWAPDPPDLNALIREKAETEDEIAMRLQAVARQQLTEMGVPLAPDLNAAIREHRAKEKN